jgi:diaminopimelate epimerase
MGENYGVFFTKLVASGNDFILLDNVSGEMETIRTDFGTMAADICRRNLSVGADGILVLEKSDKADLKMRIINSDGTEAEMCGNGARCAALYASCNGFGTDIVMETAAGLIGALINGSNVKLKMSNPTDIKLGIQLGVGQTIVTAHHINTGVPHTVQIVDGLEIFDVEDFGRKIREHSIFSPKGTNVDFVGDIKKNSASLRTYERGVEAETLSCGTGTVASAIILGLLDYVSSPVRMNTRGGETLTVFFNLLPGNIVRDVYLEGPAKKVYEGKL